MKDRRGRWAAAAALAALAAVGMCGAPAHATPSTAQQPAAQPSAAQQPATDPPAAQPPSVAAAVPIAAPFPLTGDRVRDEQWHLKALNIADAWAHAAGDAITVAVIDSGVDAGHPDLAGQVLPGIDLVTGDGDGRTDPVGHGTTVSAIIAGRGDDQVGVVGIAPNSKILPVRVLDRDNRYDDALIVATAVRWAVDHGARVINLSLGGNGSSAALAAALDYAFAKDVVVVACTGNTSTSGAPDVWYPAREPGVIAVAGLERDGDTLWSGSITGRSTVVSAPATQLLGARPGDAYWRVQGTSFAAPMVSGTAALIRSRWPTMPAAEVINRIIRTATDLGVPGRDDEFGFGRVDPTATLTADVPPVTRNPLDTAPPAGVARFGNAPAPAADRSLTDGRPRADAPDSYGGGPVGARASGANAGWVVEHDPAPPAATGGWWTTGGILLISGLAALLALRRRSGQA